MRIDTTLLGSSLTALFILVACASQDNPSTQSVKNDWAEKAVQAIPSRTPALRAQRLEDLEDRLRPLRSHRNKSSPDFALYRVSPKVGRIDEDLIALDLDGQVRWIVLVASSGEVFRLAGFDEAEYEFSRAMKFLKLFVRSEADAKELSDFYLAVVRGLDNRVLGDKLQLRHGVESFYHRIFSRETKAEEVSRAWWSSFLRSWNGTLSSTRESEGGKGFVIVATVLDVTPQAHPQVVQMELLVSKEGSIRLANQRVVFRTENLPPLPGPPLDE